MAAGDAGQLEIVSLSHSGLAMDDFIRVFADEACAIPPEQVIGSQLGTSCQIVDGVPTVVTEPGVAFIDDKEGKPLCVDTKIGERPFFVGSNSDGYFAMLDWSTAGAGPWFGLIAHHTDAEREFAYDLEGSVGRLGRGLDDGLDCGWFIVDMQEDWNRIWPSTPMRHQARRMYAKVI